MTTKEVYLKQSKDTGIKVGDTIRILRKFDPSLHQLLAGEMLGYTGRMGLDIGEQFEVLAVRDGNFVVHEDNTGTIEWPWYCVELLESIQERPTMFIENKEVIFYDGFITFNGLNINRETIEDILTKLDEVEQETENMSLERIPDLPIDQSPEVLPTVEEMLEDSKVLNSSEEFFGLSGLKLNIIPNCDCAYCAEFGKQTITQM